jgi:hypothetical protein
MKRFKQIVIPSEAEIERRTDAQRKLAAAANHDPDEYRKIQERFEHDYWYFDRYRHDE